MPDVYFYVDITVTVPQYLGCKKATVLFIGYQMTKQGSRNFNFSQGGQLHMATKKKAAKKKKKK